MKVFGTKRPGVTYVDRPGAYGFLRNDSSHLAVVETPVGLFLPGGGIDPGETQEQALRREFLEEIGFAILSIKFVTEAAQFQTSGFYKEHFKKIGSFYAVEAVAQTGVVLETDHRLLWLPIEAAARTLSQEFQRWALNAWVGSDPRS